MSRVACIGRKNAANVSSPEPLLINESFYATAPLGAIRRGFSPFGSSLARAALAAVHVDLFVALHVALIVVAASSVRIDETALDVLMRLLADLARVLLMLRF